LKPRTATGNHGYYCLAFTALAGVVISLYYYFGVIRAIYWSKDAPDLSPIPLSAPAKVFHLGLCIAGMFWIGMFPNTVLNLHPRLRQFSLSLRWPRSGRREARCRARLPTMLF
jgi:NADH:ubiquinone oxidoreductase subunit 2 (subunit N)